MYATLTLWKGSPVTNEKIIFEDLKTVRTSVTDIFTENIIIAWN
jgi:hypothetical protein